MHAMRPPFTPVESVTDVLHGVPITDPYRWLEDQDLPRTRAWIKDQTTYGRAYLDLLPGRDRIRRRVGELLAVETIDSVQKVEKRYFYRRRLPGQEQPCIYMRHEVCAEDQLLVDPRDLGTGKFIAVQLLRVSPDARLLLYSSSMSRSAKCYRMVSDTAIFEDLRLLQMPEVSTTFTKQPTPADPTTELSFDMSSAPGSTRIAKFSALAKTSAYG
jgi:prolyl oligopeptidase